MIKYVIIQAKENLINFQLIIYSLYLNAFLNIA